MSPEYYEFLKIYSRQEHTLLRVFFNETFKPWFLNNFVWAIALSVVLITFTLAFLEWKRKSKIGDGELIQDFMTLKKIGAI